MQCSEHETGDQQNVTISADVVCAWSLLLRLCFVLVAAVVLEAGDAEEALAAHVAGELGEAVRGVPGGHVLVEVQLKLNRCWFCSKFH